MTKAGQKCVNLSALVVTAVSFQAFAAFGQGPGEASALPSLRNAVKVSVDPAVEPIKDLRQLKAGAGFGFNSFL